MRPTKRSDLNDLPGTIHYSGRVGDGYPVQEPYKPPRKNVPHVPKLTAYERACTRHAQKMEQRRRAFEEMMRDPDSKHHGSGYSYAAGCPCRCEKCIARRKEYAIRRKAQRDQRKEEARKAFEEKVDGYEA